MEKIEIKEDRKIIEARNAMLNSSYFNDVAMANVKIINANLSDLEIEGAHPMYDPEAKQRPLRFEDCDLNRSTITRCNLTGVAISDCYLNGMTINGILVEDLLQYYKQ